MQYREFGNTGIKISALGFGAMRLPCYEKDGKWYADEEKTAEVIHRAIELGVNYFDTAYMYNEGTSENAVGKALKGYRDKVYLSTKLPPWGIEKPEDARALLEEQLKKLDEDYIDFYHLHAMGRDLWNNKILKYDVLKEMDKAKSEGLIKHLSFSFHDSPEFLKELIDTGLFSSVLCQYNLLDRSNEEAISYARKKGLGTVIMGPVAGGKLMAPSDVITGSGKGKFKSTPEVALRFVLGNPDVCCALSGMSSIEMLEENAKVASIEEPLSKEEWENVNAMLEQTKRLAELYCTGCNYCMPCPKEIKIPDVFRIMNYHRVYGLTDSARQEFGYLGKEEWRGRHPEECIECGECETKCPQKIKIREQLKEVIKELS